MRGGSRRKWPQTCSWALITQVKEVKVKTRKLNLMCWMTRSQRRGSRWDKEPRWLAAAKGLEYRQKGWKLERKTEQQLRQKMVWLRPPSGVFLRPCLQGSFELPQVSYDALPLYTPLPCLSRNKVSRRGCMVRKGKSAPKPHAVALTWSNEG